MPNFTKKKLLLLGFLFVILLVIPLTVYLLQQQQQTQSHANPNTTLSFSPQKPPPVPVGSPVSFDIVVNPGNNQVNFIKLVIKYDPTKLEASESSFTLDPASNLSVIQGPTVGTDNLSVVLSVQNDPTKVIQQTTKIGSVSFNTLAPSDTTEVSFDPAQIQIRSIASANNDAFNENVFLNGAPAEVTIQDAGAATPGPTEAMTPTVEPTISAEPTITDAASTNQSPICESLQTDVDPTGVAPFTINFTVRGNDPDGTLSKVTFNYSDGPTEDVATTEASLELTQSHTFADSGSFTTTALLTDNQGAVSDTSSCSVTVTVSGGGEASAGASITPLPATGPKTIVGIGALGGLLLLVGTLLFFAL